MAEIRNFHEETFDTEFEGFLKKWKSQWKPGPQGGTHGPYFIHSYAAPFLRPEQLEAERPEQEELKKLVEYCATTIAIASLQGQQEQVIERISSKLEGTVRMSAQAYSIVMNSIFSRTLELLRPRQAEKDLAVGDLMREQRTKLNGELSGIALDFGHRFEDI